MTQIRPRFNWKGHATTPKPSDHRHWFDGWQAGTLPLAIVRTRRWYFLAALMPMVGLAVSEIIRRGFFSPALGVPGFGFIFAVPPVTMILTMLVVRWLESRVRRRAREADNIACDYCVYDLRNLSPTGTCPECGREYDAEKLVRLWEAAARPQSIPGR